MALAVVSMCLTSAGSCGSPFRRAVFPSGSGVFALPGMEAARRGRIGLACKAVAGDGGRVEALTGRLVLFGDGATPGGRATVACEAAGIHGGDSPLDPMMYGARPIGRWLQKNVMTMIFEMLVRREAGEGSTISIDATDDHKALKVEVVKKAANPPGNRSVPSLDPQDDSNKATEMVFATGVRAS